jgi:general secretion pathway protein G
MVERIMKVVKARIDDDNDEQGFTLVELLIVVIVLGILAAVTVFGLSGATAKSAVSACNADAKSVEIAVEAYRANQGVFPPDQAHLLPPGTAGQVYLRIWPNSTHYAITLDATPGQVDVNGANYDVPPPGPNPCASVT